MMNTIEYRVDCQLLEHLHWDNLLASRFPIGKLDQVEAWRAQAVRDFHARWYFPANATLYVVGDFDATVDELEDMIGASFGGRRPPRRGGGWLSLERHRVRPPVKHACSAPSYELEDIQRANDEASAQGENDPFMPFVAPEGKVSMFQHEHLSNAELQHFFKARNPASRSSAWAICTEPSCNASFCSSCRAACRRATRKDECGLQAPWSSITRTARGKVVA